MGKSAIALRYVRNVFDEAAEPTIGACFFTKRLVVNDVPLKLQIWDTAGQERFRSLAPMYYHGAAGALLVFDMTVPQSFEKVRSWAEELNKNLTEEAVLAVVGSKKDLFDELPEEQRASHVLTEAMGYAKEIGAIYFETSAKVGDSVPQLFSLLGQKIVELKHITADSVEETQANDNVSLDDVNPDKKKGCC